MRPEPRVTTPPAGHYSVRVIGAPRAPLRDLYFALMRLSWPSTLGVMVAGYLLINAIFGAAFYVVRGVDHMPEGSFIDAFYFSVQTMGTIGYGAMSPSSHSANALVVVESVVSLVFTAMTTGLVFAKFSRPNARVVFSRNAVIGPVDGVRTLSFRLGNMRSSSLLGANVRVALMRTETSGEGNTFYKAVDLKATRDHIFSLGRSWQVNHVIDSTSPLHSESAESLTEKDAEVLISVTGTDDTWMQTVHATHRYFASEIAWNSRHADILSEVGNDVVLDLTKFHDVEPA